MNHSESEDSTGQYHSEYETKRLLTICSHICVLGLNSNIIPYFHTILCNSQTFQEIHTFLVFSSIRFLAYGGSRLLVYQSANEQLNHEGKMCRAWVKCHRYSKLSKSLWIEKSIFKMSSMQPIIEKSLNREERLHCICITFSKDLSTLCLSRSFWILKAILCRAPLVTF